jgi:hypothetical protein
VLLGIVLAMVRSWAKYSWPSVCADSTTLRGKKDLMRSVFAGCDGGSGASVLGPCVYGYAVQLHRASFHCGHHTSNCKAEI